MKVAAYIRDEFTEADREHLAIVLDGARLDRYATRAEIKDWLSQHGLQWKAVLEMRFTEYVQQDMDDLL